MPRDITEVLLGFARTLRYAGMDATPERVQAMLTAVDALGVTDPSGVYWGGRLALCAEPDDIATYDAAFQGYFQDAPPAGDRSAPPPARQVMTLAEADTGSGEAGEADRELPHAVASDVELLRHRDVTALTAVERAELRRLLALLAPSPAPRLVRRQRRAPRGAVDPARTVARMLRHAGEPSRLARRARQRKPRRLVLLVDVSGSMAPYADALLRFAHAAVRRRPATSEVFTIGTRMTRITRALRLRDPDAALAASSQVIPDWSGGTRLGEAVKAFLDRWGQRGAARGAIVVVFSDGWERGDPALLAAQMRRLARLAYRVVWVNPHKGKAGYAPLAGGMAAALPYLDEFVAGHSFGALEELVRVIARA
ncbi:MAG TPA: VWA domain-containing protein [Micromonosporaceae bacterium]|nr:VWA domain-containing protein [Micromonosporaceae bacterium]